VSAILGDEGWSAVDDESSETQRRWDQDIHTIGRILRAHLFVEHYINEFLEQANPRLGSLARARLTFAQKIELIDTSKPLIADIRGGIRHLNAIRNRLAHRLDATITEADSEVFLSAKFFKAARDESAKRFGQRGNEPIDLLEEFARFAGGILATEFSVLGRAFAQAFGDATEREIGKD
jgi:hypothetical protein